MRDLSEAMRLAMYMQMTSKVVLTLFKISHTDLATPIYIVNDTTACTRGGITYTPFPCSVVFPKEKDGTLGNGIFTIDNTDRSFLAALRTITTRINISAVTVLSDTPDVTEVDWGTFQWEQIVYDANTIQGDLVYADMLDVQVPSLTFSPANVPGNF